MNTKLSVIMIIVSFLIGVGVGVVISGNNGNTNTVSIPEFEKFIGTWKVIEYEESRNITYEGTWIFYKNHSLYLHVDAYNETSGSNLTIWRTFEVFEGELKLTSKNAPPIFYQYEFSDDGKRLTLIDNTGKPHVLTKEE